MRAGVALILASTQVFAGPVLVQSKAGDQNVSLDFPSDPGNVRLVCAGLSCGCWGENVSDSEGNTYTMIGDLGSVIIGCCSFNVRLFYTVVADAGIGPTTVYGPPGDTFGLREVVVTEYSGLESLVAAQGNTGSGMTIDTGNFPDAGPTDFVSACAFTYQQLATAGPWVTRHAWISSGSIFAAAADTRATDAGLAGATFSGPDAGWVTMAALFKASPTPDSTLPPPKSFGVGCYCGASGGLTGLIGIAIASLVLRAKRRVSRLYRAG